MRISVFIITIAVFSSCISKTKNAPPIQVAIKSQTPLIYPIIIRTSGDTTAEEPDTLKFPDHDDTLDYPGDIDTIAVQKLTPHLKALAAFYAAIGGSWCDDSSCDLTTALGLGKQGSALQESLIKKYFPNDSVAADILQQDCKMGKDGSSAFNDFGYLTITDKGDTVIVDYVLLADVHGEESVIKGQDIYLFKDNVFQSIKRNWKY
jgi:hypothetical protein